MPKSPPPAPDDPASPAGEIVLYQTEDGRTRVECRFVDETLWLSQALIGELFQVTVATVNEHIKNVIAEGEVAPGPTIRKFRIVRREGPREVEPEIEHYNLEAILAVGYRVRFLGVHAGKHAAGCAAERPTDRVFCSFAWAMAASWSASQQWRLGQRDHPRRGLPQRTPLERYQGWAERSHHSRCLGCGAICCYPPHTVRTCESAPAWPIREPLRPTRATTSCMSSRGSLVQHAPFALASPYLPNRRSCAPAAGLIS